MTGPVTLLVTGLEINSGVGPVTLLVTGLRNRDSRTHLRCRVALSATRTNASPAMPGLPP
jgi:hypothetical protein